MGCRTCATASSPADLYACRKSLNNMAGYQLFTKLVRDCWAREQGFDLVRCGRGLFAPAIFVVLLSHGAAAETLESALARAYSGNPTLGAQRASVRATDENVPRALALGRPRVTGTADVGAQSVESV